ncbi:MAG: hypothetical protein WAL47_01700 [Pyrinomonadaceae bacterium]
MDYKNDEQDQPAGRSRSLRRVGMRVGIVVAGVGLGSALAYLIAKALGTRVPQLERPDNIVDDRGTSQEKAARMLLKLRDRAFDASDEKLAVALGRSVEEVAGWSAANSLIDDDVVMKARGIAMNRGVHIE